MPKSQRRPHRMSRVWLDRKGQSLILETIGLDDGLSEPSTVSLTRSQCTLSGSIWDDKKINQSDRISGWEDSTGRCFCDALWQQTHIVCETPPSRWYQCSLAHYKTLPWQKQVENNHRKWGSSQCSAHSTRRGSTEAKPVSLNLECALDLFFIILVLKVEPSTGKLHPGYPCNVQSSKVQAHFSKSQAEANCAR